MPDLELSFLRYFADLSDSRVNRTEKYARADILGVTLCAVICGPGSFEEIARFGDACEEWLNWAVGCSVSLSILPEILPMRLS